jgi:hypothetical protein
VTRRDRRWLGGALLAAFIVWNGVFDWRVTAAAKSYVKAHDAATPGRAAPPIEDVMPPAVRLAAVQASWSAAAALLGLGVLYRSVERRDRRDARALAPAGRR